MKRHKDFAIVLTRINYGDKDRILTVLCRDAGKITVLAKGVRGQKSRLAGGVELLSISEITYIETGKSNIVPLTGARLDRHFGEIAQDLSTMQRAFAVLKVVSDHVEQDHGQEYYEALVAFFASLCDPKRDARIAEIWFYLYMLRAMGSEPNLRVETSGEGYIFNHDLHQFELRDDGPFNQRDIKLLRLCATQSSPPILQAELGSEQQLLNLMKHLIAVSTQ
jgi:DNA repair protein RecO (recombination protein O)